MVTGTGVNGSDVNGKKGLWASKSLGNLVWDRLNTHTMFPSEWNSTPTKNRTCTPWPNRMSGQRDVLPGTRQTQKVR